jgi:superfamily II DNA/RNA helicase
LAAGYTKPTPIQSTSWLHACAGRDCLAIAKTGSGKTAGYLLPSMTEILKRGLINPADKVK